MSWGFSGLSSAVPANGTTQQANAAPNLESIETEQLGFQALNGERKVRLIPSQWSTDNSPSKTASLLSIASSRGLVAAAGPDILVIHSTEDVRSAFTRDGASKLEDVEPQKRISIPRISHLAFSSDENALVIAAEEGGGLAIYDVNAASSASNWTSDFQISTSGVAVRHLLPNPNKDSSHLFGIVLADGKLLVADLKSRNLTQSANGSFVLRENVSCASWSKLGKQLVAGLADGSALQLDVQGNEKDTIPKPPEMDGQPVTSIYWLENPDFLLIHAPLGSPSDDQDSMLQVTDSVYHLVHRDKQTKACSFHRFSIDPCPPFLDERFPAQHFIQRLREWQPNLDDTLIVSCTASTDVGVLTRSKVPLSQDLPADHITHTYTTTSFTDTRRAALPMSTDGMGDTYPIGMALDLSSRQKVRKPIPNDETLDESTTPLPQLCILNQEGVLSSWWFIYNEGIRQNKMAPGLVADGGQNTSTQPSASAQASAPSAFGASVSAASPFGSSSKLNTASPFGSAATQNNSNQSSTPAFGQSSVPSLGAANTSSFGKPSAPAFGQSSFGKPSFGTPSAPAAFGGATALGKAASPWGSNTSTATTTSTPAFGKSSFGAPSQMGAPAGSAFGQVGGMGLNKASPWGAQASAASNSQPTSAFGANGKTQSPFAAFAPKDADAKPSPFAGFAQTKTGASPFASFNTQATKQSPFASQSQSKPGMPNETSFGSTVTLSSNTGSFGSGNTLTTPSLFGKTSETREANMDDGGDDDNATVKAEKPSSGLFKPSEFKLGSTFKGDGTAKDDLPKPKDVNASLFGLGLAESYKPSPKEDTNVKIKSEPEEEPVQKLQDIPEAPETAKSSVEDAPLPPDFITTPSKPSKEEPEDAPLPPDFMPTPAKSRAQAEDSTKNVKSTTTLPSIESSGEDVQLPEEADDDGSLEEFSGDDELDEDEGEEDGGEGEEEEGEEEGEDDPEEWEDEDAEDGEDEDENQSPVIVDPKGLSAFESRITPASPRREAAKDESTTPETVQKPTFTPAGFPKPPLNFQPLRKVEESPRSPSPVRAVTSPVSFNKQSTAKPPFSSVAQKPFKPASSNQKSLFEEPPPVPDPETLEDENYLRIKEILESPIEPSTVLPDFIAHQDYNGGYEKPGIAGQLEKVYRDVNSMIDTLGLNARALQAFIAGHSASSDELEEDHLGEPESWHLGDLTMLSKIQTSIDDRLDRGRLTQVGGKIEDITDQENQMERAIMRTTELRKQLSRRTDAQQKAQHHAAPLPAESAAQQSELRQSVQQVQKALSQVEQDLTLLRADLSSISSEATGSTGVPTVEAVTNTILKMTSLIEKRSGDVDVLEAQIRRLPDGFASLGMSANYEDNLVNRLEGSSLSNGLSTPRKQGHVNGEPLGMSGMFGSTMRTPPSLSGSSTFHKSKLFDPSASFLGRSTSSLPGSARKKIADVTAEEVNHWKAKVGHRQKVLAALKRAVESSENARTVNVSRM